MPFTQGPHSPSFLYTRKHRTTSPTVRRARDHILFLLLNAPAPADVFFRWRTGGLSSAGQNGARGHEQVHQPGEPGCLPTPDCGASGHRHVLYCLVLRLRGHLHQVHTRHLQRAPHLLGGLTLHGLWSPVPPALGRHLCLSPQGYPPGSSQSPCFCKLIFYHCHTCPPAVSNKGRRMTSLPPVCSEVRGPGSP